ncbi:MAG TPA: hypothetical protein VGD50_07345 [Candidatus Baltobacteraceae bacterium]
MLTSGAAGAALPPRIAIIPEAHGATTAEDVDRFVARLGNQILKHPQYELVDRLRLQSVLSELGFANSAYADPATAAKLGKLVGASSILHATLSVDVEQSADQLNNQETIDVESDYGLIEVQTARITATGSADGSQERDAVAGGGYAVSALGARRAALDACADDLIDQLALK